MEVFMKITILEGRKEHIQDLYWCKEAQKNKGQNDKKHKFNSKSKLSDKEWGILFKDLL